ncbi:PREDICTED: trypsin-1-like [Wasmannia auropunctata]|uniref:trypsin-1-like n=1 Tax=Wasmannia auropunctata TaxID=64793 RepID=UPI0005EEABB4|nr:PREDICTED: trypsin-1-like [Wasmannia auropunctata]
MLIILCLALIVSASCLDPRIIGGTPTTIDEHPYQVSLHYDGEYVCGGSIINKQWILTAAHCVYGGSPKLFRVRVGSTYYHQGGTLIADISAIILHKQYRFDTFDYDVALIKLLRPLTTGPNVRIIILENADAKVDSKATVAGWGKMSENGPTSKQLRRVVLPIMDQQKCRNIYQFYRIVTPNMLCAGDTTNNKDTCQGDSGGALVFNGAQIGIVSWGAQCESVGFPGVYTRVSAIRRWITEQTNV